jgi:hypothetical protein
MRRGQGGPRRQRHRHPSRFPRRVLTRLSARRLQTLPLLRNDLSRDQLVEIVDKAGLRGCGGRLLTAGNGIVWASRVRA